MKLPIFIISRKFIHAKISTFTVSVFVSISNSKVFDCKGANLTMSRFDHVQRQDRSSKGLLLVVRVSRQRLSLLQIGNIIIIIIIIIIRKM